MIRIAITGPESSGKTTLAKQLASHLEGCLVEEYAREYLMNTKKTGNYSLDDLVEIAGKQYLMNLGRDCKSGYLVCDTELTVIKIWAMDKFGYCPGEIISLYERQQFDLIFLCKPDFPWQPDPMREDPERRKYLFGLYVEELFLEDEDFFVLSGSPEERLKAAIEQIKAHKTGLKEG
jgi:nicotinamide riboside kinase